MDIALDALRYVNNALYIVLALICWRRWSRTRHKAAGYAAMTFGILAFIAVQALVLPDVRTGPFWFWFSKVTIAILVLFPFFLYRFATAFVPVPRSIERIAVGMTGALVVLTLLLPELPGAGEMRPPLFRAYVIALLSQWTMLSVVAAGRLWRAGKGQPRVARWRMRLMALAASFMNVALIFAGLAPPSPDPSLQILTQSVAGISVLLFYLGFEPPNALRMTWRRGEEAAFRQAVAEVVAANTPAQVASRLLPHVARILGAHQVGLLDQEGTLIAEYLGPGSVGPHQVAEEMRFSFPHGTLVVSGSPYTPFFGDAEVELVEFLGTLVNIALERSRLLSLQQLVLKDAGEGIFGIDAHGHVTFVNPSGAAMLGFEVDELIGAPMHEKTHHSHADGSTYARDDCPIFLSDGETRTRDDEVFWRKDGTSFPVEYTSSSIREGEKITGAVVLFSDISERKRAEKAAKLAYERERRARIEVEEANKELESFVYTVSHDLNSPLVSISGYLDYLHKDYGESLPEQGRFYLERMGASALYMQALIRDLLEFSRVGRMQTETEPVSLGEIVGEVAEQVRAVSPEMQIDIDELPSVLMNPVRVRQLFANLLQNAARYAGRNPNARIEVVEHSEDRVCLSVSDNGPGIPPEQRERVFGVFERLAPKHTDEGTGMGLAICKRIVESNGGRIWIEDSDSGTDLRMTLPLARSSSQQEAV